MTSEERQAEQLAAWLDGHGGPDGLDDDVAEAVFALRPELAAPPSLSVDDILGGIEDGPFADAPKPAEAEVVQLASRRPRWLGAAIGGTGILLAAALALVVVLPSVLGDTDAEAPMAQSAPVSRGDAIEPVAAAPKVAAEAQPETTEAAEPSPADLAAGLANLEQLAFLDDLERRARPSDYAPPPTSELTEGEAKKRDAARDLADDGDYAGAGEQLSSMQGTAAYQAESAQYYATAGQTDDALAAIEAGLAREAGNTAERSQLLWLKGRLLRERGDAAGAEKAWREAAQLNEARTQRTRTRAPKPAARPEAKPAVDAY